MAGKPKPTHLKVIQGNPGHYPLNKREPKPLPAIPLPPLELSPDAMREWKVVSVRLYSAGILSEIDGTALAAYCQAYGRWQQAERSLAIMRERDPISYGLIIKTHKNNIIQNPLVGTANKAMADMVRYASEFGMTPSARSRIKAEKPGGEQDPAAKYF